MDSFRLIGPAPGPPTRTESRARRPPNSFTFTRNIQVTTTSLTTTSFQISAGQATIRQQIPIVLATGSITDYPFDQYEAVIGFAASDGSTDVPVTMTFRDADPFFVFHLKDGTNAAPGEIMLTTPITRSRSTFILAWFMVAAMWALALAVRGAAVILVHTRPGLIWPALGWMAATLFALVSLRNAAPGSPPIGSLIDYLAFFWAEGIIAVSVTATAATGIQTERHRHKMED